MNIFKTKVFLKITIIFVFIILFNNKVFSQISYYANTGLFLTPSASVVADKHFNISFKRIFAEEPLRNKTNIFNVNYGLTKDLEVGATSWEEEGNQNVQYLSAKYNLTNETDKDPEISIGLIYGTNKNSQGEKQTALYVVASQKLIWPKKVASKYYMRGHLGIGNEIYKGGFGALELVLNETTRIISEYDSKNFNYGLRINLTKGIALEGNRLKNTWGVGILVKSSFNKK